MSIYDLCGFFRRYLGSHLSKSIPLVDAIETLRRLGYGAEQPLPRRIWDSILIFPTSSLAIVAIPKNASTSLIASVSEILNLNSFQEIKDVHEKKPVLSVQHVPLGPDERYSSIGILREPLTRVVSLFLNKVATSECVDGNHIKDQVCVHAGKRHDSITFTDFIEFLGSIDLLSNDPHLAPQVSYIPSLKGIDMPILLTEDGELRFMKTSCAWTREQSQLIEDLAKSIKHTNRTSHSPVQICGDGELCDAPISVYMESRIKPIPKELCSPEAFEVIQGLYSDDFECYNRHILVFNMFADVNGQTPWKPLKTR